jgi:hypothetical protein
VIQELLERVDFLLLDQDKGIFAYGKFSNGAVTNATNLVSNTGVVAADTTAVGTARQNGTAAGFSFSA